MNFKIKSVITFIFVFAIQFCFSQKTITGKVSDNTGPLPGVNITVKGSPNKTSTDFDGTYSMKVKEGDILVFTFIGMRQVTRTVDAQNVYNMKMSEDSKELSEVVVTALGIKKSEKALGYGVARINGDEMTKTNNQNFLNSLSGKVAGLQVISSGGSPGAASRLVVRGGNKSITNGNEPLYVIDGVPISNANDGNANTVVGYASPNRAADINPNDIENISVLKGTAGAVLYGNRGSNGVIIITTKSGKNKSGRPVIEYTSQTAFDNALKLPDFQTEFAQGSNNVTYAEGTSRSFGPRITGQTVNSAAAGAALGLGPQPIQLTVYDPRKEFLKTGLTVNNNISISNSTEKFSMFASIGQSKQTSIVPNQLYQKFNARFNGTYKFSEKFNAGVNLSYNNSNGDLPFTGQEGNNPFFALFHTPVSWNLTGYGYERPNGTQINFRGGSFDNPLWSVNKNSARSESERYIMGVNFAFDATNWLKISYRLGNDYLNDQRIIFKDINTGGFPVGNLTYDDVSRREITSTLLATINKKITEKFNTTLVIGQDFNSRTLKNSTIAGTELVLPLIQNTNNIKTFDPTDVFNSKRVLFGVFGDLSFSYNNYLFLNLVARNEWSSTLPKQNRSFFYPGVSTSLIFTDALGIKSDILSYGKLRAGVSKTGRDANPYLTEPAFRKGIFADGFTPGITFPFNGLAGYTLQNTLSNTNLNPEFTTEYEVGLDLRLFKERVSIDASYFRNVNTEGIIPLDISPATGYANALVNSGKTTSKGFEILLKTTPILLNNFRWDISFNFSRIRSNVEETYPGVDKIFLGGFAGNPAIFAVKGERYGSIIGSQYERDGNGNIKVNNAGNPLFLDGKNLGHTEADWTGGLNTTITYKQLSLSGTLDVRQGGYLFNGTESLMDFYGVTSKTLSREDDYIFPGVNATTGLPNTTVVKRNAQWYAAITAINEEYVYENNWVKLREVNLNYSFKLKDTSIIKNLDLSIFGRNLFLWSNVPHIDPESSSFGTGNAQGASRFAFPTTRSIGFNLRVQF